MSSYFAIITKSKDGNFIAEFPDIPEAFTQGKDLEECFIMAQDVLNGSLSEYVLERKKIPVPSSFEIVCEKAKNLYNDPAEVEFSDTSFTPLVQIILADDISQKPVKIMISLPKSHLEYIDQKAEKLGMTRSGFLVKAALAYE